MGRTYAFSTGVGNDFIVRQSKPEPVATPQAEYPVYTPAETAPAMTPSYSGASYSGFGEAVQPRRQFRLHVPAWVYFIERHKLMVLTPLIIMALAMSSQIIAPYWYDHAYSRLNSRIMALVKNYAPPATINGQPLAKDALTTELPASQLSSRLHSIVSQSIVLELGNNQTTTVSNTIINGWLQAAKSSSDKQALIAINPATVSSSLSQLASQYVKASTSPVVANESGTPTTILGGTKGTKPLSIAQLTSEIRSNATKLMSGQGFQLSVMHSASPVQATPLASFGKLIDVNLTTKRLYAYNNGQLVNTFLVSAGATVTPTPVGEFHVLQKIDEQTISGTNPNGTTYYEPHVLWSDTFDNSGDAISGNSSQPTGYFGNINTSRGSVDLQNSDAEWVYNWAAVGTTVITHN